MKWLLVIAMVVATVLSDLLQSHEMKLAGEQSVGARGLLRLLRMIAHRRFLILAIACMAVSFSRSWRWCKPSRLASLYPLRRRVLSSKRCWPSWCFMSASDSGEPRAP